MILKLLILSTLVTSLFAAEAEIECKDDIKAVQFGKEVISLLPGKVCPTNDETILKRVKEEYKKHFGALPQLKRVVKGFNLTGSDKELKLALNQVHVFGEAQELLGNIVSNLELVKDKLALN